MSESKAKNKGLKFDLMRVQEPSDKGEPEEIQETDLDQILRTDSLQGTSRLERGEDSLLPANVQLDSVQDS